MGKVILLGAGPGDVGLLTLRGKEAIEQADCIVYDRLIGDEILSFAQERCEMIYAGKENRHHALKQEEINELLYQKALQHDLVVRVKGGDPYVFGRGGEEALYLAERGIRCEVVPGVSSFIAALADAGIPITHRAVSRGFQVMTAHARNDEPLDIPYGELLNPEKTCVFMMGLSHLQEIAQGLIAAGRAPETPAAVISNGTRNNQRKCIGTLSDIAQLVQAAQLPSPAVIAVGEVAALAQQLSFFEKRPLFGKKLLVPYIESICFSFTNGLTQVQERPLAALLTQAGAQVVSKRVGSIQPVECSPDTDGSDWMIFTSKNGVYAYFWNLTRAGRDLRSIGAVKIAVVGRKTAAVLRSFGLEADLISVKETGADLGAALAGTAKHAVWFCAEETGGELEAALGDRLEKRVCYRNAALTDSDWDEAAQCDAGVYTSAAAARRAHVCTGGCLPGTAYSIGPACSAALRSLGITNLREADSHSYEGLLEAVEQ